MDISEHVTEHFQQPTILLSYFYGNRCNKLRNNHEAKATSSAWPFLEWKRSIWKCTGSQLFNLPIKRCPFVHHHIHNFNGGRKTYSSRIVRHFFSVNILRIALREYSIIAVSIGRIKSLMILRYILFVHFTAMFTSNYANILINNNKETKTKIESEKGILMTTYTRRSMLMWNRITLQCNMW